MSERITGQLNPHSPDWLKTHGTGPIDAIMMSNGTSYGREMGEKEKQNSSCAVERGRIEAA